MRLKIKLRFSVHLWYSLSKTYDLIISLHCYQRFPSFLVQKVECINIHPGLNPYNRGWYPHVFSIVNKLPLGATIHEIDEDIDHGAIIAQHEVSLYSWDTSLTAYDRVVEAELSLIKENLIRLVWGDMNLRQCNKMAISILDRISMHYAK